MIERFLPEHNTRFALTPTDATSAWRCVRRGTDLERVCSFYYEATVLKDNTVRLGGSVVIDIPPGPRKRSYAGVRVEVRQLLDGSWRVYAGTNLIATAAPSATPGELRAFKGRRRPPSAASASKGLSRTRKALSA